MTGVEDQQAETRCGFVAILGAPNAGKSTLVNALVGQKVSIVTQKIQTTRVPVRGIAMRGHTQIIFVDTPGIFTPKRRLDRAMVSAAWKGADSADAILVVVDAADVSSKPHGHAAADTNLILEGLGETEKPPILVLNKTDAIQRELLLPLTQDLSSRCHFSQVFMISAATGEGLAELLNCCADLMPKGPFLYPEDQAADIPSRLLAAEITREKLYLRLHDELPYASSVVTESWKEQKDGSVRIDQLILVQRPNQKAIVVGKGGQAIKAIGQAARIELENLFGRRVHLFLHAKVLENWQDRPAYYREWGLEFPAEAQPAAKTRRT
ncbi:MAG TPA: GTPase Era [Micropepsaceae bacterium]|nr:GTPase Era [Micropepsaceae bacterium]